MSPKTRQGQRKLEKILYSDRKKNHLTKVTSLQIQLEAAGTALSHNTAKYYYIPATSCSAASFFELTAEEDKRKT